MFKVIAEKMGYACSRIIALMPMVMNSTIMEQKEIPIHIQEKKVLRIIRIDGKGKCDEKIYLLIPFVMCLRLKYEVQLG